MSANIKFIAFIVVGVLVIIGGVYLYKQSQIKKQTQIPPAQTETQPQDTRVPQDSTKAGNPSLPKPPVIATSSGAALDKYVQEVQQIAQEGDSLEITNCVGKPASLRIKKGSKLAIKNNDSKEITIKLNAEDTYTVSAKTSQTFTIQAGTALYTYICEQAGGITLRRAGALEVTP